MTERLPNHGEANWDAILNPYLSVSLDTDGTLKTGVVSSTKLAAGAISGSLGYVPVNKTGDTMSGNLSVGSNSLTAGTAQLTDLKTKGPFRDIRAYGAVIDGSTDDTTAVQAAIDAGAGEVLFPHGTCIVSQIKLKQRVTLRGVGMNSIIKQKASTTGAMISQNDNTIFQSRVTNLQLDGNKTNQSAANAIISIDHTGNAGDKYHRIDNCYITNAKGDGIALLTGCGACQIHNCYWYSNDGYGIQVVGADNVLHNLSIGLSGKDGVYLNGCQGTRITDVTAFFSGQVVTTSANFLIASTNHIQMNACFAQDAAGTGAGFQTTGFANGTTMSGCQADNNHGPVLKTTGMTNSNIQITIGNAARTTSTYAVDFSGGSNTGNVVRIHGFTSGYTTFSNGSLTGNYVFLNGVAQPTVAYTPTNVTTDRSYDANATSIDELADVLGTLIADLQSRGHIS